MPQRTFIKFFVFCFLWRLFPLPCAASRTVPETIDNRELTHVTLSLRFMYMPFLISCGVNSRLHMWSMWQVNQEMLTSINGQQVGTWFSGVLEYSSLFPLISATAIMYLFSRTKFHFNVRLRSSQTYTATPPRPLRDWQFSPIAEVATRSPIGPGVVAEKSATSRGPRCDQISRSQVFEQAQKPGCDWFSRRQVPAKSPTSPRSVAD